MRSYIIIVFVSILVGLGILAVLKRIIHKDVGYSPTTCIMTDLNDLPPEAMPRELNDAVRL